MKRVPERVDLFDSGPFSFTKKVLTSRSITFYDPKEYE